MAEKNKDDNIISIRKEYNEVMNRKVKEANDKYLQQKKREKLASGGEEFTVEKAIKYYYPEWADDEEDAKRRLANLEINYYCSEFYTLKEWGEYMEKYELSLF